MAKVGLLEISRWTLKQSFIDRKYQPGRNYMWFKLPDWQDIQKLGTVEEKVAKMIDDVIYIGIDVCEDRFEKHLSPFQQWSPFDRYLKLALAHGEKFVCIYFGTKTSKNILYETLMINQLNMLKASRNASQLHNVYTIPLGDHIGNRESSLYTSVLVYMFKEALLNPFAVKISTDSHIHKVKNYLANLSKIHMTQFKTFVQETIAKMHKNKNGEVQLDDDDSNGGLVEQAVDWKIFKLENNTLKLNCKH